MLCDACEFFFERLYCGVGTGVFGADRDQPKAQLDQKLADSAFVKNRPELGLDPACEVSAPSAHHAISSRVSASLNPGRQLCHLIGCEPRLHLTAAAVAVSNRNHERGNHLWDKSRISA